MKGSSPVIASRSFPVFLDAALASPLARKRALYFLLVAVPVFGTCVNLGHGIVGCLLFPLCMWPFPFRCRVEDDGIRISWFVFNERIRWGDIRRVELGEDRRSGVIGKPGTVLALERRGGSWTRLRGRAGELREIASQMAARMQRAGESKEA
jgi:hypothetical protein